VRIDGRSLLAAWRLLRAARVDPFASGAPEQIPRLPGWSALGLPASELASARAVTVLDALRAMALLLREPAESANTAHLVATLPLHDSPVTSTRDALRVLITSANTELLVIGYTITDPTFRDLLIRRAQAGVQVTVVGDRKTGAARELRRHWPAGLPLTSLEDVETADDQRHVHAKVVVADRQRAIVGSANFTLSGMGRNMEMGVGVVGPVAAEIVEVVEMMQARRWLCPP
jgi:phosphatidylserine/phosphatidylglycerophosphate/cardiolipin synthase-like enzyme